MIANTLFIIGCLYLIFILSVAINKNANYLSFQVIALNALIFLASAVAKFLGF